MRTLIFRLMLLSAAFTLSGCGGGGMEIASTPPPPPAPTPPPPPPPPPIIPAATTSQQFAAVGSSHSSADNFQTPLVDDGEQLQIRYVASTNSYEVQLPGSQAWAGISYLASPSAGLINYTGGAQLWLRTGINRPQGDYRYSRLLEWSENTSTINGHEAIGMATPAGGVPVTGSATYNGQIIGQTSEDHSNGTDMALDGSITLSFNFGSGSLSGSINANFYQAFPSDAVGPINFTDTVYSTGNTTFSGRFDTNLQGVNSFRGLFTGPNAEEVIGNFAFPYRSPIDNQTYQADGAFVGAR